MKKLGDFCATRWLIFADPVTYNEACDLLIGELNDRFEQRNLLPPVLALESVLLNAANGLNYQDQLTVVQQSCYKDDFNFSRLESQLGMLADAIKVALPSVRKVTSVRTICDAMNAQTVYKTQATKIVFNSTHHNGHFRTNIFSFKICSSLLEVYHD